MDNSELSREILEKSLSQDHYLINDGITSVFG